MSTTFYFTSAEEITPVILEVIKRMYQQKPVSLYIQDNEPFVPQWQIEEVRRRDAIMGENSAYMLDCDAVMCELEQELEAV